MAGLFDVALAVRAIGQAAKLAAADVREAADQIRQDVAEANRATSGVTSASGGEQSMGASTGGSMTANSLATALKMQTGRL